MTTKSLEVSVVIREENINYHKLSFRSRSGEILSWAQQFGGGGHLYSAGAWVEDSASNILKKIHQQITEKM
jgi:nanoRNase/pAp phosphatase (c-di-AMP/oligoRNAs hydrolase)